jgi:hypothetical protein
MASACCGVNVKDFGAKGDTKKVSGGKIDSGSKKLIFRTAHLMEANKSVNIEGAGLEGRVLSTTIISVDSASEVTLYKEASKSVDSANVVWGTDDSSAIRAAEMNAYIGGGGGMICFGPGTYIITTDLLVRSNVTLTFTEQAQIYLADSVTFTIAGSLSAPPQQIFSGTGKVIFETGLVPRVYPQWWGAYSNGSTTMTKETTTAIQAAANSLHSSNPRMGQVLEFLPGHYLINDEIALGPYANKVTGSGAIIEIREKDPARSKKIFNFWNAYMLRVSGLQFIGGGTQISISNPNTDMSMFRIENCIFDSAKEYAIEATPTPPAIYPKDHLSAILTIDNCKFFLPKAVLNNRCDIASVNNCWVSVGSVNTPSQTAIFMNGYDGSKTNSRLYIHNMVGVPGFPPDSYCRWIDNYGSVSVDNTKFGGEAGGISIIYHYAKHWYRDGRWPRSPTSVVIRDSWVFTGYDGKEGEHAVLSLRTDIPAEFIYEGNFGPAGKPFNPPNFWGNPLIRDGGVKPDLDKYIKSFPPNYFRFVIEPNEMTVDNLPESLRPLVSNFERFGNSKPTEGVWERGQHLWNSEPIAGGILGWVCVESGIPGKWKEFGAIAT